MDFAAAAVRYSDAPNALEGGDLGWRGLDEIPPTFANVIRTMQAGQVIGPVRGPSGFQLLKLVEQRDAAGDGHAGHRVPRAPHPRAASTTRIRKPPARAEDRNARRAPGRRRGLRSARQERFGRRERPRRRAATWAGSPSDRFGPTFGSQVAALADGGVSKPFRTDAGCHIVQRVGTRQGSSEPEPAHADARGDRPAQARGRIQPLPARNARRGVRRTAPRSPCRRHRAGADARSGSAPAERRPPKRPRRRPPTAADDDAAAAGAGAGRAGRHRPRTLRAARADAADGLHARSPSPIPARLAGGRRCARSLPLRVLRARGERADQPGDLRRAPGPQRRAGRVRPRRSAQRAGGDRRAARRRASTASTARSTAWSPARCTRPRSTPAASPTPAPPNCSHDRPDATW